MKISIIGKGNVGLFLNKILKKDFEIQFVTKEEKLSSSDFYIFTVQNGVLKRCIEEGALPLFLKKGKSLFTRVEPSLQIFFILFKKRES